MRRISARKSASTIAREQASVTGSGVVSSVMPQRIIAGDVSGMKNGARLSSTHFG